MSEPAPRKNPVLEDMHLLEDDNVFFSRVDMATLFRWLFWRDFLGEIICADASVDTIVNATISFADDPLADDWNPRIEAYDYRFEILKAHWEAAIRGKRSESPIQRTIINVLADHLPNHARLAFIKPEILHICTLADVDEAMGTLWGVTSIALSMTMRTAAEYYEKHLGIASHKS